METAMEQINRDMNLQVNEASETSEKALNISGAYRKAMARLIVKTRLACSSPTLDAQELAATVEAWCEILFGAVPGDRLNDCYIYAMRHRESTFALAATEILSAWRILNAEESLQRERSKPCALCHGHGFGMVYEPKTDTEILKECPHCNGRVVTSLERVQ